MHVTVIITFSLLFLRTKAAIAFSAS